MIRNALTVFSKRVLKMKYGVDNCNCLLRSYFSVFKEMSDEIVDQQQGTSFEVSTSKHNESNIQSNPIKQGHQSSAQKDYSLLFKDFMNAYKENKARLERVSVKLSSYQVGKQQSQRRLNKQNEIFDESYVKKLVDIKYFYADIVNVASQLIEDLIRKINVKDETLLEQQQKNKTQIQTKQQSLQQKKSINASPITITHLHFLFYIYQLYPKQAKNLKDRMITLIDHFLGTEEIVELNVQQNMEFLFYFRKFIEGQLHNKINKDIQSINVRFTRALRLSYVKRKQLEKSTFQQSNSFSKQMIQKAQILHNYLLIFPNLWNSSKKIKNQQYQTFQRQNQTQTNNQIPKQALQVYDYFVEQFSQSLKLSISYWLNSTFNDEKVEQFHNNFIQKKNLEEIFKKLEMKKLFGQLKISTHRLFVIFDPPKLIVRNSRKNNENNNKQLQSETKQQKAVYLQKQDLLQQYIELLIQKYSQGKLNIITYFPSEKLTTQNELLKLMILIKNLISYHMIRNIDNNMITDYLFDLFENNNHLINTDQSQFRRQIKFIMGEIVSKLTSAGWMDKDDHLRKFFTPKIPTNKDTKVKDKRDLHEQWYEVKDY